MENISLELFYGQFLDLVVPVLFFFLLFYPGCITTKINSRLSFFG